MRRDCDCGPKRLTVLEAFTWIKHLRLHVEDIRKLFLDEICQVSPSSQMKVTLYRRLAIEILRVENGQSITLPMILLTVRDIQPISL